MPETKMTTAEIEQMLPHFSGTTAYFRHWTGALVYTEGVAWLAENAGAFWLIDAIAAWQADCRRDRMLREMQFWTLKKFQIPSKPQWDGRWVLYCERDENDRAFQQVIDFSDFPLDGIKLWVAAGGPNGEYVLMLPGEY